MGREAEREGERDGGKWRRNMRNRKDGVEGNENKYKKD